MAIIAPLHALVTILCPAWCTRGAGHRADLLDTDGSRLYLHRGLISADAGGKHVSIRQAVTVHRDGTVAREAAEVVLDEVEPLSLVETRALVAGLVEAALYLDAAAR